jgi:hypothetical protein
MPPRTALFQMLPWVGGINTSLDPAMIPPNQLVTCDNVIMDTRGSKRKRDGINFNWDGSSSGAQNVVGLHDFWFGTSSKTQRQVAVFSDRTVYSYSGGTRTQLTVAGTAWSGTLTSCSMVTFGNKLFIAVSGAGNVVKYWDGTNSLQDLYANYNNVSLSRASSGTTRTLVFSAAFGNGDPAAIVGSTVIVAGGPSTYNGTWTVATISTTTVANDTITYTASSSLTEGTTTDTAIQVGKPGPTCSILREHFGRIFGDDKTNKDRLHFSQTFDPFQWLGGGDSGARDIGVGDGDPIGINGISPTFKGNLFVGKKTKLYRCSGDPMSAEWYVEKVSDSLGFASHNGIAPIDQDDVFFVSDKGIHSLEATQQYGDFQSQYVSIDIQKTFNESFNRSRLGNVWGAYLANINSVAFAFSSLGSSVNDSLYLYHIPGKAWYTWSNIKCESLIVANDSDKRRFYIGSNTGRVAKTFNGTNYDISASSTHTAISYHLKTGLIYPGNNPTLSNGFKRLYLHYKPTGTYSLTATAKVDNFSIPTENILVFSDNSSGDLVGSTFVTGSSVVGYDAIVSTYSRVIDGYGKGVTIEISQSGVDQTVEIQGYSIEYEPSSLATEVFLR